MGCGAGRHAFALYRRGADVTALDMDAGELKDVAGMLAAMDEAGEAPPGALARAVRGTAYALPFADASFDRVVASEVLEHLPQDRDAMAELVRVLRPGGLLAVTVRGGGRSWSAGRCPTPTTRSRAGTSASTAARCCASGSPRPVSSRSRTTTRTRCTRRTGG
jgi:SAM-dependent methyltransferase